MTPYLLPVAVLVELLGLLSGATSLSVAAGVLFLVYFMLILPELEGYARYLAFITLLTLAALFSVDRLPPEQMTNAAAAAAFYGAFLGSLGMMQCLVRRFEVLRRIHDVLLGGASFWLYPKYALTSCAVASVLNFGVMNLLCGALSDTLRERGITGTARLRWLRSVLSSTLRGFALVPLIAPTSVAVAIITREVPSLSWAQLLPYGATAALLFIGLGWRLEHRRFQQISTERARLERWPDGSITLILVVAAVFGVMAGLVLTTRLNVSRAAMVTVPVITVLYMLCHDRVLLPVLREVVDNTVSLKNEMCIFAASAALGVTLAAQVPPELLANLVAERVGLFGLAVVAMLILPLFAAVGIAPITVLSFLAGLLSQLTATGTPPLLIAVALVIGFSLAMMLSPFGPSVMLLARFGKLSRWVVAFGWNGLFALASLPLMLALLGLWYLTGVVL
ncbi:hypothetical protein [Marinobacter caseinilyticus]|uniref:hypothetical protein n=1 Tax=Marinobacter caseinilyticus TaxID=2692195 RepID=UPI001409BCA4|nr:hypothetical protein [Marinobacter caseinilyticus]